MVDSHNPHTNYQRGCRCETCIQGLKEYRTAWSEKNRDHRNMQARIWRANFNEWLAKQKDYPCTDCGIKYDSWVMDFDHISGDKLFNISMGNKRAKTTVEKEIKKCELVCANCHRKRTHDRMKEL